MTVEPANVTRLQWIVRHDGELAEAVKLGEVAVMSTGCGGRDLWAEMGAGEGRVHDLSRCGVLVSGGLADGLGAAGIRHCYPGRHAKRALAGVVSAKFGNVPNREDARILRNALLHVGSVALFAED